MHTPIPQPDSRPAHLPVEILWSKDDCKEDEFGAKPVQGNDGRPRMQNAIREKDGSLISKSVFKAIQQSVIKEAANLIQDEEARLKRSLPSENIKKSYFEKFRMRHWWHAIAVIEEEHPILTYAAAHWKTVQLLINRLTAIRTSNKKTGHQSKKTKRPEKSNGAPTDDPNGSNSTSEKEGSESWIDGENDNVTTGSKRKRSSKDGSNQSDESSPDGPPSSRPSESVIHTDMDIDSIEVEVPNLVPRIPMPRPIQRQHSNRSTVSLARSVVEKRLGKQGKYVYS